MTRQFPVRGGGALRGNKGKFFTRKVKLTTKTMLFGILTLHSLNKKKPDTFYSVSLLFKINSSKCHSFSLRQNLV